MLRRRWVWVPICWAAVNSSGSTIASWTGSADHTHSLTGLSRLPPVVVAWRFQTM
nr:hypothetical protein [Glycomyces xiaoerkulensis]